MFQDRNIGCVECGEEFVFSSDDQQYHSERGYSDPKRCPSCRAARRSQSGGGGGYGGGGGGGGFRSDRPMFTTTCAQCGQEAQVPFEPRGDRPVYCNSCFSQQRQSSSY
ncbi:MAG TPA: zinc-binding protein [Dehalococcoidia bacterium]|nr:zinc-binding protein [Dehalococcoidia bacterium]HIK98067.1 zinc-binding protein [Dehalococcoidia bacterium]